MPVNPEVLLKHIQSYKDGSKIRVYVKPESNMTRLVLEEDELVFYTEEPPVGGRANASLLRYLYRGLNLSPQSVDIVYGQRSRVKEVYIEGLQPEELAEKLSKIVEPW